LEATEGEDSETEVEMSRAFVNSQSRKRGSNEIQSHESESSTYHEPKSDPTTEESESAITGSMGETPHGHPSLSAPALEACRQYQHTERGIPTHPACYHLLEDPVSISLAVDGGHTKKDRYIFSHNIIYNGTPLLSKFNLDRQPSSTHHLVRPILSVRALSEFPPASHMVSTLPALLFTITGTLSERLCSPAVELVARE